MHNFYYEALLEGRFQPAIDVKEDKNGNFVATYTSPGGKSFSHTDASQSEAFRRCQDQVIDAIRQGDINPFV